MAAPPRILAGSDVEEARHTVLDHGEPRRNDAAVLVHGHGALAQRHALEPREVRVAVRER